MATTANPDHVPTRHTASPSLAALRRLHAAAAVRIGFGLVWAIDASFKWLPAFIHGKTLNDELGKAAAIHTPVIHQWIQLWHDAGTADPRAFAVGTALVESCIALGMIFGVFTNLVFIGSAVFSFGIWSAAEGFHLPWTKPGITDLGPSVAYIFASLALFTAFAGATWSLDTRLRPALGRLAWLASPTAAEVAVRRSPGTARTT
ncbi:hypothetical protein [Streptomyces silvisoli]|uniref:DoxX family membrane protein n=1 Tax=Streptomyces silvisoli TaxID=3034235 RepID=A0ABT5ZWC8_9ACTN|nr:hypothetical protein [Streptomyces silvisoli]MDF3294134.1 hypothetical protein [Streptomyces silvisoli]